MQYLIDILSSIDEYESLTLSTAKMLLVPNGSSKESDLLQTHEHEAAESINDQTRT